MIYVKCQEKAIIGKTFLKNLNIITPYREPLKTSGFCIIKKLRKNKTEENMINWFDMPAEGLSNGGLFEVKELEVTENGTYEEKGEMYNKVVVNVEGGGGSSDFSTAEVTIDNTTRSNITCSVPVINEHQGMCIALKQILAKASSVYSAPLYKGKMVAYFQSESITTTGAIEDLGNGTFMITGDCTITIS